MSIQNNETAQSLKSKWLSYKGEYNVVGFYKEKSQQYGSFSNFYVHESVKFTIPDWCGAFAGQVVEFNFSEKLIMLCKASIMNDSIRFQEILDSKTPLEAKKLGRKVTPFDPTIWNQNVCRIAKAVVECKFREVNGLKDILLSTENALIAEATPRDKIWGIGMGKNNPELFFPSKWRGSNILGWALMEARESLSPPCVTTLLPIISDFLDNKKSS